MRYMTVSALMMIGLLLSAAVLALTWGKWGLLGLIPLSVLIVLADAKLARYEFGSPDAPSQ